MQESREPTQGSGAQSVKSTRQTRKRRRSSSSLDQLRSEDEAERQNQEGKSEKRIDAKDDDFSSRTLVEAYDQEPRRSALGKGSEALKH